MARAAEVCQRIQRLHTALSGSVGQTEPSLEMLLNLHMQMEHTLKKSAFLS